MKVLAISGSPRRGGNTEILIRKALDVLKNSGTETELISLADKKIEPCDACRYCRKNTGKCHIQDDLAGILEKMLEADGVILGTPVYMGSATAQMKAFMDRAGYIARGMEKPFARKLAGAVVVARRAGHNFTLMQLFQFFSVLGMIIVGSACYWNIAFGRDKGDVTGDEEGIRTIEDFAENMAWLLKNLKR
ncbi:flavodoxin family protein [Candidatus Aerophobetes bacterium]|nr:flavodoxin family protein [Candidatus Aerophobetes bacterium]